MPLIDSLYTLSKIVHDALEANKEALGLNVVYYGDQERIPYTPAACIEPGDKSRRLNGAPRRTEVTLTCYVILYLYNVASPESVREGVDSLAEDIETFLHMDAQLRDGDLVPQVIDSLVTNVESGYQPKRNSLFRASRLTFEARSQVLLPSNAL